MGLRATTVEHPSCTVPIPPTTTTLTPTKGAAHLYSHWDMRWGSG